MKIPVTSKGCEAVSHMLPVCNCSKKGLRYRCFSENVTQFWPMFHFMAPENTPFAFLVYSRGIKWERWLEMVQ